MLRKKGSNEANTNNMTQLATKSCAILDDAIIQGLSDSGINCADDIDLIVLNCIFNECSAVRGGAIFAKCKTLRISSTCIFRCYAEYAASINSESESNLSDTTCCCCSPNTPTPDDIFNGYIFPFILKRLNFSENNALGASSFQFTSSPISVRYSICTQGKDNHIIELRSAKGEINNLIITYNTCSWIGIQINKGSQGSVITFSNCMFAKNVDFVPIADNLEMINFVECINDGSFNVVLDTAGITKKETRIPIIEVGFSTYECHKHYDYKCSCKQRKEMRRSVMICSISKIFFLELFYVFRNDLKHNLIGGKIKGATPVS